jgi:hypothetical protein
VEEGRSRVLGQPGYIVRASVKVWGCKLSGGMLICHVKGLEFDPQHFNNKKKD